MKEKDKEVEKAVEVGHEQVEDSLLAKFNAMKAEEAEVQGTIDPSRGQFVLLLFLDPLTLLLLRVPNIKIKKKSPI